MSGYALGDLPSLVELILAHAGGGGGGGNIDSVTGTLVNGADPRNPVIDQPTPDEIAGISSTVRNLLKAANPLEIRNLINASPVYAQMSEAVATGTIDTTNGVYVISGARLRAAVLSVVADRPVVATSNNLNGENQYNFVREINSTTAEQTLTVENMEELVPYSILVRNLGSNSIQIAVTDFKFFENVNTTIAAGFEAVISLRRWSYVVGSTTRTVNEALISVRRV